MFLPVLVSDAPGRPGGAVLLHSGGRIPASVPIDRIEVNGGAACLILHGTHDPTSLRVVLAQLLR